MPPRAIGIALPAGYSVADVLKFHACDAEGVAADGLRTGVMPHPGTLVMTIGE